MKRAEGNNPIQSDEGIATDPSTATIVADTSTLAEGRYEVRWAIGASTVGIWRLEQALSTGLGSTGYRDQTVVYTVSQGSGEFIFSYQVEQGDFFRIVPQSSFTGNAAGKISAEPYL